MRKSMKKLIQKLVAIGFGSLLIGASATGLYFHNSQDKIVGDLEVKLSDLSETNLDLVNTIEELQNKEPVIKYINNTEFVEVEVEKIVNQTIEVPVNNGNLEIVLEHIYDNDGKINYITEDLDDDELDLIVERIVFINEIKELALNEVKDNLFDELDNSKITLADGSEYKFDEDDLERLKLDDDQDEVIITDVDFEDKDAKVLVTGSFEDDDEVEFVFEAIVKFKDNEIDEIYSIDVKEDN